MVLVLRMCGGVNYQSYYESLTIMSPGYWCPALTEVEVEEKGVLYTLVESLVWHRQEGNVSLTSSERAGECVYAGRIAHEKVRKCILRVRQRIF